MRIHRITVRNFRGIEERTVDFAANGVTVLEGENEVGKSSMIEALFLLLEVADSSQAAQVKSVRPVHTGRNPEVAAEISASDYQFVYEKCYGSTAGARFTRLTISKPRHEQLEGTAAHDRVAGILRNCVDEALWKALRLQQGVELKQEQLRDSSSLGAALDAAAGGAKGGDREDNLYTRVTEEYERFYTAKTGKQKSSVEDPVLAAARASEALDDLARQKRSLEWDSERCESLALQFAAMGPKESEQRALVAQSENEWKRIEREQQEVENLRLKSELAETAALAAQQSWATRQNMQANVDKARAAVDTLQGEQARAAPGAEAVTASLTEAAGRLKVAREILDAAQAAQALRTRDEHHLRDQLDVLMFGERLHRVAEAQAVVREAEAFLDGILPDEEAVQQIEKAQAEVLQASTRLEGGSPAIRVTALTDFTLGIDGEVRQLGSDDRLDLTAPQPLTLRIGDVAEVAIAGSKNAADLQEALAVAARHLERLCLAVGARDVSDARALLNRREREEERRSNAKKALEESLRDLTPDLLVEKLARTQARVAEYSVARESDFALPSDLTDAKYLREKADQELEAARAAVDEAASAHSRLQGEATERGTQSVALTLRLESAGDALTQALAVLAEARAGQPDGELEARAVQAKAKGRDASAEHEEAAARLRASDPETAKSLFENEREVLRRIAKESHKLALELADLRGTLRQRGEEGLADRLELARAESMRLQYAADAVRRRADAAKFLFDTLSRRRDESRRAYMKPFKDKIDSLGRVVFGSSFSVELRESLQVEKRTFNGVTLEFEKLSTGAKEQIGVIARLACASIVSAQGGVPLILDDALGWSDASRLRRLGAAFEVASRDCQVIVLTCQPDRYRHIGSAKVVPLS